MQVTGASLTLVLFSSNYIVGSGYVIVFADEYLTGSWKRLLRNKRSSAQPAPLCFGWSGCRAKQRFRLVSALTVMEKAVLPALPSATSQGLQGCDSLGRF